MIWIELLGFIEMYLIMYVLEGIVGVKKKSLYKSLIKIIDNFFLFIFLLLLYS